MDAPYSLESSTVVIPVRALKEYSIEFVFVILKSLFMVDLVIILLLAVFALLVYMLLDLPLRSSNDFNSIFD